MTTYADFFVDGRFHRVTGGPTHQVFDPTSATPTGKVHLCSLADLDSAIASAHNGLKSWANSTLEERRAALQRLQRAIEARRDALIAVLRQ